MKILISAEAIQARVTELGVQINSEVENTPLTVIGALTGCLLFMADLVRHLQMPVSLGFVQASSYRGTATEPGQLEIHPQLLPPLEGRHVLLVDDILDTGQTLLRLTELIRQYQPASLRVAVLLRKEARLQVDVRPDYCGFDIADRFVIGYGMDFNDQFRHLPFIAELDEDTQTPAVTEDQQ